MKYLIAVLLFSLTASVSTAQPKTVELKKVLELQMPEGRGARASSIAWHPVTKRYYAPMSGNAQHAFAIFNAQGKRISKGTETALFDVRGFWYSPQLKKFCTNGYNAEGWASYTLNAVGTPISTTTLFDGMNQPDVNSVGSFDSKTNQLYFLSGQWIATYDAKTAEEKKDRIRLHLGSSSEEEANDNLDDENDSETPEMYNYTTAIYTGIPKAEFAVLNTYGKIELYDKATGYITKVLNLPSDIVCDAMLCFSYANGMYWIFDKDTRVWKGFK